MTKDRFISDLKKGSAEIGVKLDKEALERFYCYFVELEKWNRKVNLVSRNESDWVRVHFLDSLVPLGLDLLGRREKIIDLGAGAGFPGVPIKVANLDIQLHLAEASGKKCAWLRHLVRILDLEETQVLEGRFSELAERQKRKMFDVAVSRAAAKPSKIVKQAGAFLARNGRLLVYTTRDLVEDGVGKVHPYQVPGSRVPSVIWEVTY